MSRAEGSCAANYTRGPDGGPILQPGTGSRRERTNVAISPMLPTPSRTRDAGLSELFQGSLDSTETRRVAASEANVGVADRYLMSLNKGVLVAQRYDPNQAALNGSPIEIADHICLGSPTPLGEPLFGGSRRRDRIGPQQFTGASSSGVRINHLLRHGTGRRRAEVHAVDLAHLLFEPHRKMDPCACRTPRMPSPDDRLRADEDQITLGCVLQERPLAHAKAASRRRELGLAGAHQLADKLLSLFGLARWNRKRHRQHCQIQPPPFSPPLHGSRQ